MTGLQGVGSQSVSSLAALQAQRAFAPPRKANTPPVQPEAPTTSTISDQPDLLPETSKRRVPLAYGEIQSVASRAGFIGLTEQDIQRAYVTQSSLLVDYRV